MNKKVFSSRDQEQAFEGIPAMKHFVLLFCLCFPSLVFSQDLSLSGHITGPDSSLIAGAVVVVQGTTLGTASDKYGFYGFKNLKPGTYTLRVSFIGYESQEKSVTLDKSTDSADFTIRETGVDLNEVVVTGTKTEKTLKDVPILTQVINASRMLDMGVTNVTEALAKIVPGLSMSQYGTKASVTLQGMSAKYVLFLVDGERIAGEINGDIDYSMLNLENIERIEIIKGASSSLYGSNAIGGVINIITKKITEPFDGKFYSRYSRFNELFTGGGIGIKKGIFGSRTSFNYSRTDGYDLTPESTHDWTQNPYSSFNVYQKFELTPSQKFSITPYFWLYQFQRGNVSARPAHDLYLDFKSGINGQGYFGKHFVTLSYYRDRYNTYDVLELLNNQKNLVSYDILQTVKTLANFHFSEKNNLIAGLEYNRENLYTQRIDGNTRSEGEAVFYIQEDLRFGSRWNLVAGIRTSDHESYGFNAAPKLSLLCKEGAFSFRASVGKGFRSPALKELYMNFDHFGEWYIIGNANLKPESSGYLSGSVEFSKPRNNTSVTVYQNRLTNMITDRWLPDSTLRTRQYENVASASVFGVDCLTRQKIIPGLWLSAGYSFVKSRDNQTGLQLYGTVKHSGNLALDYSYRRKYYAVTAQLFGKLMGEKFYEITDTGTSRDRPFSSWKITVSQEYKWLKFSLGMDNLFNVIIPQNLDFISPGRQFFAGLNIDLGKIR